MNTTQPNMEQKKLFFSTIEKLKKSQVMKSKIIPYIQEVYPHLLDNPYRKQRITECCNVVSFRRYLDSGNIQLISSNFCKHDRICIACATKRAMRMIKRFSQGIEEYDLYNKQRYYIVLTISHKQGDSLINLMDRLLLYKEKLARAYRNSKRSNHKEKSFFSQFDGMVISIEVAHSGKNGRHPHINILACGDSDIQIDHKFVRGNTNQQLLNEWKMLTNGTSYIHNIRKIEVRKDHFSRSGIGEVFKYAIKFSDLSMEQLAEVMSAQHSHQYRFFATYGIFRGWGVTKGSSYEGDWSEGVFLYESSDSNYSLIKTVFPQSI